MIEKCHNIITQAIDPSRILTYEDKESKVVGSILTKLRKDCHAQQFHYKTGLKKFPVKGEAAVVEELQQMHDRRCFKAIAVRKVARREKQ